MNDLDAIRIHEVAPRDGLQNEAEIVSTQDKVALIHRLVDAGLQDIEVTSFVRPSWIPQLADATEVVAQLPKVDGVRFWALVPNRRGLERAIAAGVNHIAPRCESDPQSKESQSHPTRKLDGS